MAAILCVARKSQRLIRQLYTLFISSTPNNLQVLAIDLFKTDDQILAGQEVQNEILQVDVNHIWEIVRLNSFDEGVAASDMAGTENQSSVLHWKKNLCPNPNNLLHVGLNK